MPEYYMDYIQLGTTFYACSYPEKEAASAIHAALKNEPIRELNHYLVAAFHMLQAPERFPRLFDKATPEKIQKLKQEALGYLNKHAVY